MADLSVKRPLNILKVELGKQAFGVENRRGRFEGKAPASSPTAQSTTLRRSLNLCIYYPGHLFTDLEFFSPLAPSESAGLSVCFKLNTLSKFVSSEFFSSSHNHLKIFHEPYKKSACTNEICIVIFDVSSSEMCSICIDPTG
jgi:hypothetical protein